MRKPVVYIPRSEMPPEKLERRRASGRAYYAANKSKIKAQKRQCYLRHRDEVLGKTRRYFLAHKPEMLAAIRERNATRLPALIRKTYLAMAARVSGQKTGAHRYIGLPILSKEAFLAWSLTDSNLKKIHRRWLRAGRPYALRPSIDRILPSRGYLENNMQWITVAENSRKGRLQLLYGPSAA